MIAPREKLSSVPEINALYGTIYDARVRGLGSIIPSICAQDSIMCHPGDLWRGDCICVHEYVVAHGGDPSDYRLSGGEIAAVRNRQRQRQGPTVELRSPFPSAESAQYEMHFVPEAHVRYAFDGNSSQFLSLVAETTGVSVEQMRSRCRDRRTASARRAAVLTWRKLNRCTSEIAASLSIGVPAATQLARRSAEQDFEARRNADTIVALRNLSIDRSND